MLYGMFVFFICSLSPRFSSIPLLLLSPYASAFHFLLLFISPCFFSPTSLHLVPRFHFLSVALSQCSVSCGGGVQTRSIQCLRQGRPAAGCLSHQRPVTSRACNTHFCPAAPMVPAQRPGRVTAAGPTPNGKVVKKKKCLISL